MLLLSHLSDLMEKALRRQREPLDGMALGASVLLHAILLAAMAFIHFKAPTQQPEKYVLLKINRVPDDKLSKQPIKLAQATGERPKQIKMVRPKPPKRVVKRHDVIKLHRHPLLAHGRHRRFGAPRLYAKNHPHIRHIPQVAWKARPRATKPDKTEVATNEIPTPKPDNPDLNPPEKPEPAQPDSDAVPEPPKRREKSEEASTADTDDSGPKSFEAAERPKATPQSSAVAEHGGGEGARKSPLEAEVPKPDLKNADDTPPVPAGAPDAPDPSEKRVAQVPGVVPDAEPGGKPRGGGPGRAPGDFQVARREEGDGGGFGPAPARRTLGGGPRHPDLLASAGGPGDPDLPASAGAPGGVEKPGNDVAAPRLPEHGMGADLKAGADDFRPSPSGITIPSGGGVQTLTADRARGSAPETSPGLGPKITVPGGRHGAGVLKGDGPGNGGLVVAERPGGSGGPEAAVPNGSGGKGELRAAPGLPETGGAGGTLDGGPIVSPTGAGGGVPEARATDVPRGDGTIEPGVATGVGDRVSTGNAPPPAGITLPVGDPFANLGPGAGDGGPGEKKTAAGIGVKPTPNGVYVNTTGDFDVPLAVTSSDYDFNSHSVNKVVDEINGRTKIKVKLGDQSAALKPAALRSSPVLVFNGHRAFRLTPEQRAAIRAYVANGGMIWADFTGGKFDDSFVEEMRQIFGQDLQTLGPGHPIYNSYYRLDRVPAGDTGIAAPFEGISQNGRLAVVVTRNRYLGAVDGAPHVSDQTQEGAIQAAVNIYVYGAQNFKANRQ